MKVNRQCNPFQPVTITLETQEEVDWMMAIVNHCHITDNTPFSGAYVDLIKYASRAHDELNVLLDQRLKARFGKSAVNIP